jgi:hypothetical protein
MYHVCNSNVLSPMLFQSCPQIQIDLANDVSHPFRGELIFEHFFENSQDYLELLLFVLGNLHP